MDNNILTMQKEIKDIKEKHMRKSFFNRSLIWLGVMILLFMLSSGIVSLFNMQDGGILSIVFIMLWIVLLFVTCWNIVSSEKLLFKRALVFAYVIFNGIAYSNNISSTKISLIILGFSIVFAILTLFILFRKIRFVNYFFIAAILFAVAYFNNFKISIFNFIILGINLFFLLFIITIFNLEVEVVDFDTLNKTKGIEFVFRTFLFFVAIFTNIISIFG